jgi:hypothetical protein
VGRSSERRHKACPRPLGPLSGTDIKVSACSASNGAGRDKAGILTPVVRKIADLWNTPDEVLIAEHDTRAVNTSVGTDYYMDELERRSRERAAAASHELAVRAFWLSIATTVLSVVAVVVSVIALLQR